MIKLFILTVKSLFSYFNFQSQQIIQILLYPDTPQNHSRRPPLKFKFKNRYKKYKTILLKFLTFSHLFI